VDQLENESAGDRDEADADGDVDDDEKPKARKRKRDSETAPSKPKAKGKTKKESIESAGSTKKKGAVPKPKKNGVKSKAMVESEDDGDRAMAEDEDAGPSKQISPPPTKKIKREKEDELYHRGMDHAIAIKRFVHKMGRYPASLEQLEDTNHIRFLRKRYKDPMTPEGEWRLVHVGEAQINFTAQAGTNPASQSSNNTSVQGSGGSNGSNGFPPPGVTPNGQSGLNSSRAARALYNPFSIAARWTPAPVRPWSLPHSLRIFSGQVAGSLADAGTPGSARRPFRMFAISSSRPLNGG